MPNKITALMSSLMVLVLAAGLSAPSRADQYWSGHAGSICPQIIGIKGKCDSLEEACDSWVEAWGTYLKRIEMRTGIWGEPDPLCVGRHIVGGPELEIVAGVSPVCDTGQVNASRVNGCQDGGWWQDRGKRCNDSEGSKICKSSAVVGNPIELVSGNKFEEVVDYETAGAEKLSFIRYYNSRAHLTLTTGMGWSSNYHGRLRIIDSTTTWVERPHGQILVFNLISSVWTSTSDIVAKLEQVGSDWTYTTADDTVETYDSTGRLTSIETRNGYERTLTYDGTSFRFTKVADSFSRELNFTYTATGIGHRLTSLTVPGGAVYKYQYIKSPSSSGQENLLEKVIYPDNTAANQNDNPFTKYIYESTLR